MIKFRAWDKQEKRMLVVYRISFDGPIEGAQVHCYLDDRGAEGSTEYAYDGDGLILEQFTGLKDVNGKDIYEGDILENRKYRSIVKFARGKFLADVVGVISRFDLIGEIHGSKVIGNVHANPELLKG
ncbi:YopX family protein [Lactiplantibacillus plantarum]|uniref:YopX family protein n=1 Tax=Lactiplantibacillus plantarum TaxID=1590 RepID=UPI00155A603E|nr:YopX family protein [Lactiplantibacillus plantarum]USZ61299.1 YopX family protein [Lactiplantibacillus plantarum]